MPKNTRKVTEVGDKELKPFKIDMTGKLITSSDASRLVLENERTTVIDNFTTLKNIRYKDNGVIGIRGMSKINSTATTNPKIRNVHQFTKSQPAESHVLAQAYDASTTNPVVYKNDTAIPGTGDFTGTALHTDASGAGMGRFENAPHGRMAYCNGVETMVWGGDESRLSNFTVYNPDESFKYDYTEKVQNTLSDASNVASLYQTPAQVDTNTQVLFHFEDAAAGGFDDSSTAGDHDGTQVGSAERSAVQTKFGTYSLLLDGASDWVTIADHADIDLSGGTWTVDMWIYADDLDTEAGLYAQGTTGADTDYMAITVTTAGAVKLSVIVGGSEVLGAQAVQTANGVVSADTWHHVAVVSTAGASDYDYYIFVDGVKKASLIAEASLPASYNSTAVVGARITGDTSDLPFTGHIDEFRLSDNARWTSDFDVATGAYGSEAIAYMRVGNILPISGINWTVSTANGTTGTVSVFYWNGSAWTAVGSLSDGTDVGGVPLAQTGSMTFTSTASVAKTKLIDGTLGFWYLVQITKADTTTRISNITVTEPWQDMQDFWDGELRVANSTQLYGGGVFKDYTYNVFEDEYSSLDTSTIMSLDSITTSDYIVVGTFERSQALNIKVVPDIGNSTSVSVEVEYWNGSAWTSVGAVTDGTNQNGASLAASGYISWNPLGENVEFRREVNKSDSFYFYKLSWSGGLDSSTEVYHISSVPVQKQISNYKFSLNAQNRLFLCSDQADRKNTIQPSAQGTLNSFNGKDASDPIAFGDETEITAAAELFTKLTTGIVSDIIIAKRNSMYLLTGSNPEDWARTRLSEEVGCPAPMTLKSSPVGMEYAALQHRHIVLWQSENGIMAYDSSSVYPVSDAISDRFDQTKSGAINLDKVGDSYSFWDTSNGLYEYHWCFAAGTSTTIDTEMVYDLRRQKWWEADRGSSNRLQCGLPVTDTNGAHYSYGCTDNGFLERLENGTAFTGDGSSITYTMEFGDIMPAGYPMYDTVIRYVRLSTVAKETTTNSTTVSHYADMNNTENDITMSMSRSGYRVASPVNSIGSFLWPKAGFHRLKFVTVTNDETIGFEPLWVSGFYKVVGDAID